jgi:CBS domain containing-hemolysin-like protein
MALVVDEYGRLAGLLTMEDLLQSLFGDIVTVPPDTNDPSAAPKLTVSQESETSGKLGDSK